MKKLLAIASVVVMSATLSSCGGDDGDGGGASSGGGGDYCDQIETIKSNFEDLDFSALSDDTFTDLRDSVSNLEDAAPDDVKDDWATLGDALDQFNQILADAGLTLDDLQAISEDPSNLPDDVDLAALQELGTKMAEVSENGDFEAAGDAITENVKEECGIDLDDTSTDSTEEDSN